MNNSFEDRNPRSRQLISSVVDLGLRSFQDAAQRIDRLFRTAPDDAQREPIGAAPTPQKLGGEHAVVHYAIGDVHGRDDLLEDLLQQIAADAASRDVRAVLIFLGDFVNRGPHSRQVIERMMQGPTVEGQHWIALCGNHDRLLVNALLGKSETAFRRLMRKGGAETLASYGLAKKDASLARAIRAVPGEHLNFLAGLPLMHVLDGYLFVHAGVDPRLPLDAQSDTVLMTIREPFLRQSHLLPITVVHGHIPSKRGPVVAPGRIGIDTEAYATGVLTAVALQQGEPVRFMSTSGARPVKQRRKAPRVKA